MKLCFNEENIKEKKRKIKRVKKYNKGSSK
jgi:hypothetical protein